MIFPEIKEIHVSVGDTVQFYPSTDTYTISYLPPEYTVLQIISMIELVCGCPQT